MRIVAFTGHRPDKLGGYNQNPTAAYVKQRLTAAVRWALSQGAEWFITGGALGVDTWAAEEVLRQGGKLCLAQPFEGFTSRWREEQIQRFEQIRQTADYVHTVSDSASKEAFLERNKWMVDKADVIIAVWDGSPGGTAYTVDYAKKQGKKVYVVNPTPPRSGGKKSKQPSADEQTARSTSSESNEVPPQIRGLLNTYSKWVVLDMPYNMTYREYQNIRQAVVMKLADLSNDKHMFVLPAVSQSVHFMDALMALGAPFIVVLPRKIENESVAVRSKLETVVQYDKAIVIEQEPCRDKIEQRAKRFLDSRSASPKAKQWAKSALANLGRADYIDGLKRRESIMRYVLTHAKDAKFISIFRGKPEYFAAEMKDVVPTWPINLRATAQAA